MGSKNNFAERIKRASTISEYKLSKVIKRKGVEASWRLMKISGFKQLKKHTVGILGKRKIISESELTVILFNLNLVPGKKDTKTFLKKFCGKLLSIKRESMMIQKDPVYSEGGENHYEIKFWKTKRKNY
ncbi:hypothetical protein HOD29_02755 [archaeon]|jgi:hypothetical protein|nr:hypothetical protein [archaeon]